MEESEKMRGLKKAYAEIILNTAKEAAARILVSEKRVQQVNHDLSSTKDEAFRLLLRLKQTMDSKLNEAEMKSLHQQRRIEELEAQLQEAEDIVSNLRAELNEAHIKMDEMEHNQKNNQPNNIENAASENVIPNGVLATQVEGQSNTTMEDYAETDSLGENGGYVGVPDVNGCTQRVHAYEGNFSNDHIPTVGESEGLKDGKTLREGEDGKIYTKSLVGSDVEYVVGKELEMKNVQYTNSDAKLGNLDEGFPNLRPKDRVLKYTFERKRKKEALSGDDVSLVPQEKPVKIITGKKQNSCIEQPRSSLGDESSRDSRRMAQVARQLISLSEKKWRK